MKVKGRQVRRSLETDDRALAKRRLTDLQRDLLRVDVGAGRLSLADLCDRFLATVANQSASTREQKTQIATRIKNEWPGGAHVAIGKVTPSSISTWLASYQFGASSHNHHLLFIRAAFQMAVDDKLLAHSPAAGLVQRKREKPIQPTPTFEEFRRIVADARAQRFNADHGDIADFIEGTWLNSLRWRWLFTVAAKASMAGSSASGNLNLASANSWFMRSVSARIAPPGPVLSSSDCPPVSVKMEHGERGLFRPIGAGD